VFPGHPVLKHKLPDFGSILGQTPYPDRASNKESFDSAGHPDLANQLHTTLP
jgi:hypothetical protein